MTPFLAQDIATLAVATLVLYGICDCLRRMRQRSFIRARIERRVAASEAVRELPQHGRANRKADGKAGDSQHQNLTASVGHSRTFFSGAA